MCFQKHKPGEIDEAADKVKYCQGQCVLYYHRRLLSSIGGPPMLLIGDSYINHLKTYVLNAKSLTRVQQSFQKARYLGVGGTGWEKCHDHWKGINLTQYQKHLGNQWDPFMDSGFVPLYTVIDLGANDVDVFQQELSERDQHLQKRDIFWRRADHDMRDFFNYLKVKIFAVMRLLRDNLPRTQFLYVKINPRPWWGEHVRMLAR